MKNTDDRAPWLCTSCQTLLDRQTRKDEAHKQIVDRLERRISELEERLELIVLVRNNFNTESTQKYTPTMYDMPTC